MGPIARVFPTIFLLASATATAVPTNSTTAANIIISNGSNEFFLGKAAAAAESTNSATTKVTSAITIATSAAAVNATAPPNSTINSSTPQQGAAAVGQPPVVPAGAMPQSTNATAQQEPSTSAAAPFEAQDPYGRHVINRRVIRKGACCTPSTAECAPATEDKCEDPTTEEEEEVDLCLPVCSRCPTTPTTTKPTTTRVITTPAEERERLREHQEDDEQDTAGSFSDLDDDLMKKLHELRFHMNALRLQKKMSNSLTINQMRCQGVDPRLLPGGSRMASIKMPEAVGHNFAVPHYQAHPNPDASTHPHPVQPAQFVIMQNVPAMVLQASPSQAKAVLSPAAPTKGSQQAAQPVQNIHQAPPVPRAYYYGHQRPMVFRLQRQSENTTMTEIPKDEGLESETLNVTSAEIPQMDARQQAFPEPEPASTTNNTLHPVALVWFPPKEQQGGN